MEGRKLEVHLMILGDGEPGSRLGSYHLPEPSFCIIPLRCKTLTSDTDTGLQMPNSIHQELSPLSPPGTAPDILHLLTHVSPSLQATSVNSPLRMSSIHADRDIRVPQPLSADNTLNLVVMLVGGDVEVSDLLHIPGTTQVCDIVH